tara:strand:+ start:193 stop:324 length:132 start_codon:yes stop_codon:yes gene_type:complete
MKKKADRIAKSEAARTRRRSLKKLVIERTERLYTRLRKNRKSK